jgi:phage gp37-like protein
VIAETENAIIARLIAASDAGALGYTYTSVETYPDDWQSYWKETPVSNFPAAWVTWAGARTLENYGAEARLSHSFGLIVAAQSYRNQTDVRHGEGPAVPGSYQLSEDAIGLLLGNNLGLPIGGFELGSVQLVALTDQQRQAGLSMIAIELITTSIVGSAGFEPDLPDLSEPTAPIVLDVKWDLPPRAGIDAGDTISTEPEEEA